MNEDNNLSQNNQNTNPETPEGTDQEVRTPQEQASSEAPRQEELTAPAGEGSPEAQAPQAGSGASEELPSISSAPAPAPEPAAPQPAIVQPTVPAQQGPAQPAAAGSAKPALGAHKPAAVLTLTLAALTLVLASLAGGYLIGAAGNKDEEPAPVAAQVTVPELSVPEGATLISECAKGRGAQYILPENIPTGPVYNVWEGKVIGIEYMVGKSDLLEQGKNYLDMPLHDAQYNHVNIGLLSQGHAGYPEPHYHVDIMSAPTEVTSKITCE